MKQRKKESKKSTVKKEALKSKHKKRFGFRSGWRVTYLSKGRCERLDEIALLQHPRIKEGRAVRLGLGQSRRQFVEAPLLPRSKKRQLPLGRRDVAPSVTKRPLDGRRKETPLESVLYHAALRGRVLLDLCTSIREGLEHFWRVREGRGTEEERQRHESKRKYERKAKGGMK